jgi:rare lipoprotein A (peptidoglycan hydrolase)
MLDISQAAAKKLDFVDAGLAWVRVEILSYPKPYKRH